MSGPRQMRRHGRKMQRYGLQPMVVINGGAPLPDLAIVLIARWIWRYRSELAPLGLATVTALAAWALHSTHPHSWPFILGGALAAAAGAVSYGHRVGLSTLAERWYAGVVILGNGAWLATATAV